MADSDPAPSPPIADTLSLPHQEGLQPVGANLAELNESQSDLLARLQGLKQDLQSWRSKLDTQVKTYKDELSELKTALNTELDQLRFDFQELRTTLQKQQEDVTASLRNLGLQDAPENLNEGEDRDKGDSSEKAQASFLDNTKETRPSDGAVAECSP